MARLPPVTHSKQTFVLTVKGASMEPKFRNGEEIFVDPEAQVENGKFVVVRMEDEKEATFKQYIEEVGRKYLKALNQAWPNPIIEIDGEATICSVVIYKGESV